MKTRASKINAVISHEYISKIKSKWFIIGTIIGPLAVILFFGIIIFITVMSMDEAGKKLAVLDRYGAIGKEVVNLDTSKYFLTNKKEADLRKSILDGSLDGYLLIPNDITTTGKATVYTSGGGGIGFISALEKNLGRVLRRQRLVEAGADLDVIRLVEMGVDISTQKITEKGTEKDYTEAYAGIGYALSFAIYIMMLIYGSFVSRSVIEEKANRIVEIIASSARPFEIMFGKVVGVGLVGLTQVLFWMILFILLILAAGPIISMFVDPPALMQAGESMSMGAATTTGPEEINEVLAVLKNVSPWLGVGFIFYFLSGYFIYATLFAAIGSAVDQEQDAAQLQTPLTFVIIIPMLFISHIMANPDSVLSTALSLFPFFSPMIMMLRVAATNVPVWQIALSVVLMIGTFLGSLWIASKIYRIGILTTGKKPSFKDLVKWIRMG